MLAGVALLTGCIKDKYSPDASCPMAQGEDGYYLSFVLSSQQEGTKADAGSPDIGLLQEQLVKTVDVYFYKADGTFLDMKSPLPVVQDISTVPTDPISSVVGEFVVRLDKVPEKMLVALNIEAKFPFKSISEARSAMQEASTAWQGAETQIKNGGITYTVKPFYMTSTTYEKGGDVICETPIPAGSVKLSREEALLSPMELYAERLAARVQLTAPETKFMVPAVTQYEGITTQVELLGWGLNALNTKTYWYKNIDPAWSFSWTGIGWSEPLKHRSHWSKDPNYDGGIYPKNYKELDPAKSDLCYVPWNSLDKDFTDGIAYCLENTADGSILSTNRADNQLYPRATHVLVKAQLSFDYGAGKTASDDVAGYVTEADYYRYKGVFYTRNNIFDAILNEEQFAGKTYYKDAAHTVKADASCLGLVEDFGEKLYVHPLVTLYDALGNVVDPAYFNKITVDGFRNGYFYYKIPIEHLTKAPATPGATYETAQYGVVRNHCYNITLPKDITGIGTGVWSVTEPIVPVTKEEDYMVSVYVSVSPWKQFENRFIFIDPSGMLVTNGQIVKEWKDDKNSEGIDNGWYF